MSQLTDSQRARLRVLLETRAEQLRTEIREGSKLDNHHEETDDDAVAGLETDVEVAAVERDSEELRQVEAALARIATPDYGLCADCGLDIPLPRLLAAPAAMRCVSCQSRQERGRSETPTL